MKAAAPVCTEWRHAPPWPVDPARAAAVSARQAPAGPSEGRQCLLRLLEEKLEAGHWRVACRRYLMLLACDHQVPEEFRSRCDRLLQRCSPGDLARMRADAESWAALRSPAS